MIIKKIINSHSKTILKKILGYFLLLNPKFYWKYIDLEKNKNQFDYLIQDAYLEKSYNMMSNVNTILEYGCGFGDRLYNLENNHPNLAEIHGYDLNSKRVAKGNQLLKSGNINKVKLFNEFSLLNRKYDFVFTSMTLIYFKEKEINEIILKLIKRSNRYIIFQEVLSEKKLVHKTTLFAHNYQKILNELGIKNFSVKKIENSNWERDKNVYGANIFIDLKNS